MGSSQSYVAASLSVCCVYLGYVHIYCSYKLLNTSVLNGDNLPSLLYLSIKYWSRAVTRRTGDLYATAKRGEAVYTVLKCSVQTPLLRSFCGAAGYGWDYPDAEFRDLPLCFPEFLCGRLLLMLLADDSFRLSPAGLLRVRQSLKTLEPIDELKKGPFTLQVRVLHYQQVNAGVEVDILLSATSRTGRPVWESVLTLLSRNKLHKGSRRLPMSENKKDHLSGEADETLPENMKQVELRVPRSPSLQCGWSSSECSPYRFLSLPPRLFGHRSQITPSLWMLSMCLAEIEKHKGVEIITAPISITAHFKEPLLVPGKVMIKFWDTYKNGDQSSSQGVSFHMEQHGNKMSVVGQISRS